MFGNSLFGALNNDPFFSGHQQRMNDMMERSFGMMNSMMTGTPMSPMLAVQDTGHPAQAVDRSRPAGRAVAPRHADPFGMNAFFGGGMFSQMDSMMANMRQQMQQAGSAPNGQFYSHSSVMSYSNTGNGQPKVYQATSSTRQGPGGVRETQKTVRDSEAAIEKMSVGRYIGDRGHVQEKARHTRTGDMEENEELHNLEETEKDQFHSEFRQRSQQMHNDRRVRGERSHQQHRALMDGRTRAAMDYPPASGYDDPALAAWGTRAARHGTQSRDPRKY